MSRLKQFILQCEPFTKRFHLNEFFGAVRDAQIVQIQPKTGQRGKLPSGVGLVAKIFDPRKFAEADKEKVDRECQNSIDLSQAGHENLVNSYEQLELTLGGLPSRALIQERCHCSLEAYLKKRRAGQ